jgi:predicted aspartyl protease
MGTFLQQLTVVGPNGGEVTVDALVDIGATFTSLPRSALERLGVRPIREIKMRLADGSLHEQSVGWAMVKLDGLEDQTPVVFGEEGSPPAIGAVTLEIMLLGVDPVEQRLVPVIGWRL